MGNYTWNKGRMRCCSCNKFISEKKTLLIMMDPDYDRRIACPHCDVEFYERQKGYS